jgi:hypothetical protein
MALRFVKEPSNIIRNAFDEPARRACTWGVGIGLPGATILLEDMDLFVEESAQGFASEFALEPG